MEEPEGYYNHTEPLISLEASLKHRLDQKAHREPCYEEQRAHHDKDEHVLVRGSYVVWLTDNCCGPINEAIERQELTHEADDAAVDVHDI